MQTGEDESDDDDDYQPIYEPLWEAIGSGPKKDADGRPTPAPRYRKFKLEDFQFTKVLGKGSFGKVGILWSCPNGWQ